MAGKPKIIGLVGRSGSGKSTIARHLVEQGAGHIDADAIVHDVLDRDEAVRRAVRNRFGEEVFDGGRIDRAALGRVVFGDPAALAALNGIVHPAVIRACAERLAALGSTGSAWVVIDAALLLDVSLPFDIDLMIALRCDRKVLTRRLRAKGDRTAEEIEARLDRQEQLEESFDRADVIVDTDRPVRETLGEIDRLVKFLLPRD
jgi:dephospho-CoA kinase